MMHDQLPLLIASAPFVSRGLAAWWVGLIMGTAGTLFPHLFAQDFLNDARIVRWIAVPVLIASAIILSDHYFRWTKGLL